MSDFITKIFEFSVVKELSDTARARALEAINKMAPEPVEAADVYVGRGHVANDAYDRSHERFPPALLKQFAATLPGKPVLLGHNKSEPASGLWYEADIERDSAGVHHLAAGFYLDRQSEIARRVRMGIAKQLSIGVVNVSRTCDLCGQDYLRCSHDVGKFYDGRRCTLTYAGNEHSEAIEASFVGVACQYGAQVVGTKAFLPGSGVIDLSTWSGLPPAPMEDGMEKAELEARVKALEDEKAVFTTEKSQWAVEKAFVEAGQTYLADLRTEITKALGILEEDAAPVEKLLATADLDTLKAYKAQLHTRIDARFPPSPVGRQLGEGADLAPLAGNPPRPVPVDNPFFARRSS